MSISDEHFDITRYIISGDSTALKKKLNTSSIDLNMPALHLAAQGVQSECVKILLEHKADPNVRDEDGSTPLHMIVGHKFTTYETQKRITKILDLLLKAGADINGRNNEGLTPLHIATAVANVPSVKFLLKHHASVNARDDTRGYAPFHDLVNIGQRNDTKEDKRARFIIAHMLLDEGADIHLPNNAVESPLNMAIKFEDYMVIVVMLVHSALWEWRLLLNPAVGANCSIINIVDRSTIENNEKLSYYHKQCLNEIREMHRIFVGTCSVFDFLVYPASELLTYTVHPEFYNAMCYIAHPRYFHYYKILLVKKYNEVMEMKRMRETTPFILCMAMNGTVNPANPVVDKILSYLSQGDLEYLVDACDPDIARKYVQAESKPWENYPTKLSANC